MVTGELIAYKERSNPFTTRMYAMVKIDKTILKIPMDHRQKLYIQKEYPVGSEVDLWFDGIWSIRSHESPPEFNVEDMIEKVF